MLILFFSLYFLIFLKSYVLCQADKTYKFSNNEIIGSMPLEQLKRSKYIPKLNWADSSLLMPTPHPCWVLQKYAIFGESDMHLLTFLKSPSNVAPKQLKGSKDNPMWLLPLVVVAYLDLPKSCCQPFKIHLIYQFIDKNFMITINLLT